jgi:uncharacterized membrane protein
MDVFGGPWGWMYWNLTLAVVPMVLAFVLFRRGAATSLWWWTGVAAFVVFLPNAPYVLTDVRHYAFDVAMYGRGETAAHYAVLFAVGLGAYVVAMWRCTRFLIARGASAIAVLGANVAACALCSVGVYLGRVGRFNSWDVLGAPHDVGRTALAGLTSHPALVGMAQVFAVLALSGLVGMVVLDTLAGRRRGRSTA